MIVWKSRKALSPVVASIILIAVTVAVSIAVAAWMGALTFTFTATEQLTITGVQFSETSDDARDLILVTVRNTGTSPVTITSVEVSGETVSGGNYTGTIAANSQALLNITISTSWDYGYNYQIKLMTSKGGQFYYTAIAPTS
ncbi:hypothetical protein H5T51_09405 [Candidatus Bathyarchaeota archaeon]|nr:hypothetical protein [Candidatus Bathyarchaeota archaeon]